jgi:VanZ family protein
VLKSEESFKFIRYHLPLLLWALVIFASSAIPTKYFPRVDWWWIPKLVHVVYFFLFTLFTNRFFKYQTFSPALRRIHLPLSLFLTFLFAVSDETHQMFVQGRHPRLSDVAIDTMSACLFAVCFWATTAVQTLRKEPSQS